MKISIEQVRERISEWFQKAQCPYPNTPRYILLKYQVKEDKDFRTAEELCQDPWQYQILDMHEPKHIIRLWTVLNLSDVRVELYQVNPAWLSRILEAELRSVRNWK